MIVLFGLPSNLINKIRLFHFITPVNDLNASLLINMPIPPDDALFEFLHADVVIIVYSPNFSSFIPRHIQVCDQRYQLYLYHKMMITLLIPVFLMMSVKL